MRRVLASFLILIMLGLSGMSFASASAPAAADAQEMPCHQSDPDKQASDQCPGAHLCCIAFMASAPVVVPATEIRALPIRTGESFAAGFVPDHLDPPPLAL
jgi:hypothetical protein